VCQVSVDIVQGSGYFQLSGEGSVADVKRNKNERNITVSELNNITVSVFNNIAVSVLKSFVYYANECRTVSGTLHHYKYWYL